MDEKSLRVSAPIANGLSSSDIFRQLKERQRQLAS
jgi:hypothetical protein